MPFFQLIHSASVHPSVYIIENQNAIELRSQEDAVTSKQFRKDICWLIFSLIVVILHLFLGMVVYGPLSNKKHIYEGNIQVVFVIGIFFAL